MARSHSDDLMLNDNTWNYRANTGQNCTPGTLNEVQQTHQPPNSNIMADNKYRPSNLGNESYMSEQYIMPVNDNKTNENQTYNTSSNNNRVNNQSYGNAMLNLGNGQLMRVYYDENNQQLIFPMSGGQYELFNHNQGLCDVQIQKAQTSQMYTHNQECQMNNLNPPPSSTATQHNSFPLETFTQISNTPTSNFIKDVLGNWEPNSTGTYSPFGQNYPLNHPDISPIPSHNSILEPKVTTTSQRSDSMYLQDTSNRKRIVAEVKPMRPSYSDVLAKNRKNNQEIIKTAIPQSNIDTKTYNKVNIKFDKPVNFVKANDDIKNKMDKKQNIKLSGSESGDTNTDETEKPQKITKKAKTKHNNTSRKWSSLDDITTEDDNFIQDGGSQFLLINDQTERSVKKDKKVDKTKNINKVALEEDYEEEKDEERSQFMCQEGQNENNKSKKRKESRTYYKIPKTPQDKKKSQTKQRKNKPWYAELCQSYLEHWGGATRKALIWFFYLLSDVCHMSFNLSFDLCTSVFTQTYVSSQAVWRSAKDWLTKVAKNKYLSYIDKKFGHTHFAFWRKLKWFKKGTDQDKGNDSTKQNTNIPLPATGDEAMKRLLACKGKDPYSILGVNVQCTDEEIKRYYRRQAFLVHPDKNQQPGAEEAFKILQHAFDLIGEPERREAYDRRELESRHMESALSELNTLLTQLHDKMEFAANTIRCTNCGRRHKRVPTDRPCYAARYCAQCKIRHSAREGDIWAESSMFGLLVMYYACMDGAVYHITQWASCQKKNLKQLRPNSHVVQYRIVLGHRAAAAAEAGHRLVGHDPNLEEFLNSLYSQSGGAPGGPHRPPPGDAADAKKRRTKKPRA